MRKESVAVAVAVAVQCWLTGKRIGEFISSAVLLSRHSMPQIYYSYMIDINFIC